jgi:small subunit ribosomal protein S17
MENKKKIRTGIVVSDKMDKTVVVLVKTTRRHPLYKKVVRHSNKFKAHDAGNMCRIGDTVRIIETRPLSKDKRWRVEELVSHQEIVEIEQTNINSALSGAEEIDPIVHQT